MRISEVLGAKAIGEALTIGPEAGVRELLAALAEHDVGALVVSEAGSMVGIVSERDVVRRLHADGTVVHNTVGAIMSTVVATAAPDDEVDGLMEVMTERRIRHVPVLDGDRLLGVVSIGDVVKQKLQQLEFERDQLDSYVHGT